MKLKNVIKTSISTSGSFQAGNMQNAGLKKDNLR